MEYYPFPALLRSGDNTVQEFGQATIVAGDNALDFTGDFVPLLPLGTAASLEWVLGERVLASFYGRVYLSSRELLRIVEIEPAHLEKERQIFATNTRISATYFVGTKPPLGKVTPLQGTILALAKQAITLRVDEYIAPGQTVLLSAEIDFLTLRHLPLLVEKRVLLRRDEALLLCRVLPTNDDNQIGMATYSAKLAAAEKKANR